MSGGGNGGSSMVATGAGVSSPPPQASLLPAFPRFTPLLSQVAVLEDISRGEVLFAAATRALKVRGPALCGLPPPASLLHPLPLDQPKTRPHGMPVILTSGLCLDPHPHIPSGDARLHGLSSCAAVARRRAPGDDVRSVEQQRGRVRPEPGVHRARAGGRVAAACRGAVGSA